MPQGFDPQEVLRLPLMAILCTLSEDGAPRSAPCWYAWKDDALWMLSDESASSARRLARDARASVEIVEYDNPAGRLRHLGLHGTATVEPMDTALFRRLLTRYLGAPETWNPWFIETVARIDAPDGRLIRLVPDSTFTNDVSYFRTGPNLARDGGAGS
ncbi:pyridoxamine 5'-phosphate oxidase [Thalassococcus profundi]|uniref:Pyridoxamine 5'-phosphate oxidase n=1 Tax=Thalassococcus profundi TaxID=2282382 RepID=A0A369TR44_9RHOB|nr:pyridoxamine 5'-phosphate oxidase family protein [Thalassococcus profundi]RDD67703.1 pyridoxamine 5'-phosphate oxidase [Thalassococcus profundi]